MAAVAELIAAHLPGSCQAIAHEKTTAVVAVRRWAGADRSSPTGEDRSVLVADGIVAAAVNVLIGEGLAIGGVKSDVLRSTLERSAEAEQLAVRAPPCAFLRLFSEVPQERNGLFSEGLGVFR